MIMITVNNISIEDRYKHSKWQMQKIELKEKLTTLINFEVGIFLIYFMFVLFTSFLIGEKNIAFFWQLSIIIFIIMLAVFLSKFFSYIYQLRRADQERKFVHFLRLHTINNISLFYKHSVLYLQISSMEKRGLIKKQISVKNSFFIKNQDFKKDIPVTVYIEN